MFDNRKNDRYQKPEFTESLKSGYQEMGMLNLSLSEEGLYQDIQDLECYENNLVESE